MTSEVYLTRTAAVLPGPPVGNERIEAVLGQAGERPSRARAVVLRSNGIRRRHYAIDEAGRPTHTNARLAAEAVRALGEVSPVGCLAAGTSTPDQLVPGHGVMVHGELGWPHLEVASFAGICLSGTAALKHAWMAVRCGETRRAVTVASELVSPYLRGHRHRAEADAREVEALKARPELAFDKEFLRWMLSDGAGAVLLQDEPGPGPSLRVDWIELSSAAHELPACMYAGARRHADGVLEPWQFLSPDEWLGESIFAVRQDVRLLNEHIVRATLTEPLARVAARRALAVDGIDWFLPHLSSMYFRQPVVDGLARAGLPIPAERWFTNLVDCGNTGSASPFIMLDALVRSGRLEPGQRLLMFVPESGRFSSGFVHLSVVDGARDGTGHAT